MPLLLTYIDIRAVKFFPPAESLLVNSNFRRASRMQGWGEHKTLVGRGGGAYRVAVEGRKKLLSPVSIRSHQETKMADRTQLSTCKILQKNRGMRIV